MNESQEQVLVKILEGLKSAEADRQLEAINELITLTYSSPAILRKLENLALKGSNKSVREAAYDALDSSIHRFIQSKTSRLNPDLRSAILREIQTWSEQGLIDPERAKVLAHRYNFDSPLARQIEPVVQIIIPTMTHPFAGQAISQSAPIQPLTPAPVTPEPEEPQPVGPVKPAEPSLTLSERLLSQNTINIALYLGAFMVVGAAMILAVLVEETRLPILLGITALFAAGSIAIKRRLPQPSFVLFVVFSFLLPINAYVIVQTLNLSGQVASAYWSAIFIVMAVIWGFSTWFYSSRLFSIASFTALGLSFYNFVPIFQLSDEWTLLSLILASLIGLLGVQLLKGWKDDKFATPLFLAAQLVNGLTLFASLIWVSTRLLNPDPTTNIWIGTSLTWIDAAAFYAWSGLLYSFPLFSWAAVGSLLPISWMALNIFNASNPTQIILLCIWGTMFSLASEFFGRRTSKKAREYHLPFLLATYPLFGTAALWVFIENSNNAVSTSFVFGILLSAGVIYSLLTVLRARSYIWLTALIFGLAAYFTFFQLPYIKPANIYAGYQLLGSSLLLLVPELFFKSSFSFKGAWRPPLFALGAFLTIINIAFVLLDQFSAGATAIVLGVYALLFGAYALHHKRTWIGYFATALAATALVYALHDRSLDTRLTFLTALSVLYFVCGYFLRVDRTHAWGNMLRISGLALGTILSFTAIYILSAADNLILAMQQTNRGWDVLVVSLLFFAEPYIRKEDQMEASGPFFLSIAAILLLGHYKVTDLPFHLLALSVIWLGADIAYSFTLKQRRLAVVTRAIGALFALGNLLILLDYGYLAGHADRAALIFAFYALFFAADAWLYRQALIGYASTASVAFAILLTFQYLHRDLWLPILTGLSIVYFACGYFLRVEKTRAWGNMLRISGLALGTVISCAAVILLKKSGEWYILIIGALFAAETYLQREDRLEISAPIFFSLAAYLGLHNFHISDFSYFLLAASLIWLGADLIYERTLQRRRWAVVTRLVGGGIAAGNALVLLTPLPGNEPAALCFGVYTAFFALYAWLYRKPVLGYLATGSLPLSVFFELQVLHQDNWLYEIAAISVLYYAAGFILRRREVAMDWGRMFLYSGLGLGVINSISAPLHSGLDAAIPVAIASTLFAIEAFARRNVWLVFPANLLYLESYFLILVWLNVNQPQFFSIGAAVLGMLMHYLLTRAGSKTGAFLTGMFSQLVLLGTTFIQLLSTQSLGFFTMIFFQALAVLAYGIVARSRSLVIAPVIFIVMSVIAVIFSTFRGIATAIMIGVTGIVLLLLGILAVLLRERITKMSERFSDWQA
jgi:hypothetical protein